MSYRLSVARLAQRDAVEALIALSARELARPDYSTAQIEGALAGAFGLDTQLIEDGTYFVVHHGPTLAGCGGWSRRATLFGGDAHGARDASMLDPAVDAARIRAFFVHPEHARRGIGRMLLERCESEARQHGFHRFELMATLPGQRLYAAAGYRPGDTVDYALEGGLTIPFVPMYK